MNTYGIFSKDDHTSVHIFDALDQQAAFKEAYDWIDHDASSTENHYEIAQIYPSSGLVFNTYDLAYHRN